MSIAASKFQIAAGAILRYAVNLDTDVISIPTVGLILMIAGAAGLILGLFQEVIWSRRTRPVAPGEVPPVEERREVRDPAREQPPRY